MSKVEHTGKPIVSSGKPKNAVSIKRPLLIVVILAALVVGGLIGYVFGRESLKSAARDALKGVEAGETANQSPANVDETSIDILGVKVTRTNNDETNRKNISEALNKVDDQALTKATFDQLIQLHTIAVAAKNDKLANSIVTELKSRLSSLTTAQQKQVDALTTEQ